MTNNIKSLPALVTSLVLMLAGHVTAQTLTTLYNFTSQVNFTNNDGSDPDGLILSGRTLYGEAGGGGSLGNGTVFAINTDGTSFTNLHTFAINDGVQPVAGFILSGNTLFGMASGGGTEEDGSLFALNINSMTFTNLHNFTGNNNDGNTPDAPMILAGNKLYGTTLLGGSNGDGTVFAINADGTGFTNLYVFSSRTNRLNPLAPINSTNGDGSAPEGLVLSGNTLYATAGAGGIAGAGTVFALNTDGTYFTNLYSFKPGKTNLSGVYTNSDGTGAQTQLILSGNLLFGTAQHGGISGNGTIFAVTTNGTGFTNLHNFSFSDGSQPLNSLILSGNTLYGTTYSGGSSSNGTVFAINTDGSSFTNLHVFTAGTGSFLNITNSDGAAPFGGLVLSGNTLYGVTSTGGTSGQGTVFALSLPPPPPVRIATTGNHITLSWPTNNTVFTLQSITDLSAGSWNNVTSGITTIGTNYTFTNTVNGSASFYRLVH